MTPPTTCRDLTLTYCHQLAEQSDKEKYNNLNAWMMQNIPKKFDVKALMEAAEGRA